MQYVVYKNSIYLYLYTVANIIWPVIGIKYNFTGPVLNINVSKVDT